MNDTMICVWGDANKGKSHSILEAYKGLVRRGATTDASVTGILKYTNPDFTDDEVLAVLDYKGVKIGIESCGDPNARQIKTLPELQKLGCNIILCASRTSGATRAFIINIGKAYDLIWFGNAYFFDPNKNKGRLSNLHRYNGKALIRLIKGLIRSI